MGQFYFGDSAAKWVRITSALTLGPMIRVRPLRAMLDYLLTTFVSTELHLKR